MGAVIKDLLAGKYWLVILNLSIPSTQNILNLWNRAYKIVCLDGAVNKLKKYSEDSGTDFKRGPDYIIGDLDSLSQESIDWLTHKFEEGSYKLQKIKDQDSTDFDKSLKFIAETDYQSPSIAALNCFGGRLDHTLAILNSAYRFERSSNLQIQLMNESCLARIIHPSDAEICYSDFVNSNCGIMPVFGPVNLETSGLQWNLQSDQTLEFTQLISTSNRIINPSVHISNRSGNSFIWTHEICK